MKYEFEMGSLKTIKAQNLRSDELDLNGSSR